MSQENVDLVKGALDAWNGDDLEAFLAALHPEIEWRTAIEAFLTGTRATHRGYAGVRQAWDEYRGESLGTLQIEVQDVRDVGDSVLMLGRVRTTGAITGIEADSEVGCLFGFRDGKISSSLDFMSHSEALEATGLGG